MIINLHSANTFNHFEEEANVERFKCHFRLFDLTRDDFYNTGFPAIED